MPGRGRVGAPQLPARTPATAVAQAREGWPALQGRGRLPGREGGEGLRADLDRRHHRGRRRGEADSLSPLRGQNRAVQSGAGAVRNTRDYPIDGFSNGNFGRAVLSQLVSACPFLPGRYLLRQ